MLLILLKTVKLFTYLLQVLPGVNELGQADATLGMCTPCNRLIGQNSSFLTSYRLTFEKDQPVTTL